MSQIKIVDPEGNEIEDTTPQEFVPSDMVAVPRESILLDGIAKMFDLSPLEYSQDKHKLETLLQYAKKKARDESLEEIKWALRSLGVKLGTPPLGERLIPYMYRFAKIHLEGLQIKEEEERFLRSAS